MNEKQDIMWCKNNKKFITVYYQRNKYDIEVDSVEYIKAYSGEVEFSTGNMKFRRKISLNEMEDLLDSKEFFRVNKSYIVNLSMIEEAGHENEMITVGGVKISISQRRKKDFQKASVEFKLRAYNKAKKAAKKKDT